MPYTGNVPPTPIPNPGHSTQGIGKPDFDPYNYWPYHSEEWFGFQVLGAQYDDWIRGRQEDMAKTFAPTLVRILYRLNLYATKHGSSLSSVLSAAQAASLARIQTEITSNWSGIQTEEKP